MNDKYIKIPSQASFVKLSPPTVTAKEIEKKPKNTATKTIDNSTQWNNHLTTISILSVLICFQVAISLNPHSGESQPPMFGDYEAQRHWMEITYNLPIEQWYTNGTHNDLLYWGLDYPPLTAYHHYLLGIISRKINKNWVELFDSRGFESVSHKLFMRISAIIPFFIFYLPPLLFFFSKSKKPSDPTLLALAVLYPVLLVIDNGHFQYNSVSLGLFLSTYTFLTNGFTLLGSISFVCALNYKQMELYHALPIFTFILSRSLNKTHIFGSFLKISKIGAVVIATFLLIWAPFLLTGTWKDVLIRVFPFNRGLYEDKVASFWCAFSFVLKRLPIIQNVQIYLSTALVLLCSLPSLIALFLQPSDRNFRISLTTTAISFFLFSFHVHEKTILLATIPALLLINDFPNLVIFLLNISNISVSSLCVKDNFSLALAFFVAYFVVSMCIRGSQNFFKLSHILSISIGFLICILELYGPSNQRFPHIYQLANAFFCCIHLLYFLASFTLASFEKVKLD